MQRTMYIAFPGVSKAKFMKFVADLKHQLQMQLPKSSFTLATDTQNQINGVQLSALSQHADFVMNLIAALRDSHPALNIQIVEALQERVPAPGIGRKPARGEDARDVGIPKKIPDDRFVPEGIANDEFVEDEEEE